VPGLGETTAMLASLRKMSASPTSSGGRLTVTEAFGANPGHLTMLSYRPRRSKPGAPLVVVLHGCTQTAEAHALQAGWLTLADRFGFVVLAPQQSPANNPNRCFNWFSPGDVVRGAGEVASIAAMVTHALTEHHLDPGRVFVTGLSAGGAMTAAMLATYPELFAGGAVVAGLPYGVARNVQEAMGVMARGDGRQTDKLRALVRDAAGANAPRLSIWHGDADAVVNVVNAKDLARQWTAVLGLDPTPDAQDTVGRATRSTWRGADGEAMVELNVLSGLGHGTPLSTKAADPIGAVAPFMLEAGVSSSLEIARFWNIDQIADGQAESIVRKTPEPSNASGARPTPPSSGSEVGQGVMAAIALIPVEIQDTIAKALRGAGLLK
jgi:poly(hydroxyalkanoate) depolymerase family esterase